MAKNPETPVSESSPSEIRGKLMKRLAIAGVLVASLLGMLAFFDYLATAPEEPEAPVFTRPVPVAPKKEVSQPVTPATDLPEPPTPAVPSEPAPPESVVEAPPAPVVEAQPPAAVATKPGGRPDIRPSAPSTAATGKVCSLRHQGRRLRQQWPLFVHHVRCRKPRHRRPWRWSKPHPCRPNRQLAFSRQNQPKP